LAVDPRRLRKLRVGQDGLRLSDRERLELVGMAIREYGVTLAGVVTGEETLLDPTGAAAEQIYRRGRLRNQPKTPGKTRMTRRGLSGWGRTMCLTCPSRRAGRQSRSRSFVGYQRASAIPGGRKSSRKRRQLFRR